MEKAVKAGWLYIAGWSIDYRGIRECDGVSNMTVIGNMQLKKRVKNTFKENDVQNISYM